MPAYAAGHFFFFPFGIQLSYWVLMNLEAVASITLQTAGLSRGGSGLWEFMPAGPQVPPHRSEFSPEQSFNISL